MRDWAGARTQEDRVHKQRAGGDPEDRADQDGPASAPDDGRGGHQERADAHRERLLRLTVEGRRADLDVPRVSVEALVGVLLRLLPGEELVLQVGAHAFST